MRIPQIRPESNSNWLIKPLEFGFRHIKLAMCDDSQEALLQLAKERIIYRPSAHHHDTYVLLTTPEKIVHFMQGTIEILGYLLLPVTLITAKVASIVLTGLALILTIKDRLSGPFYPKGSYSLRTHMQEGGIYEAARDSCRRNPFDANGVEDPFYQGASWLPKAVV